MRGGPLIPNAYLASTTPSLTASEPPPSNGHALVAPRALGTKVNITDSRASVDATPTLLVVGIEFFMRISLIGHRVSMEGEVRDKSAGGGMASRFREIFATADAYRAESVETSMLNCSDAFQ